MTRTLIWTNKGLSQGCSHGLPHRGPSLHVCRYLRILFSKGGKEQAPGTGPSSLWVCSSLSKRMKEENKPIHSCGHWGGLCQMAWPERMLQPPPWGSGGGAVRSVYLSGWEWGWRGSSPEQRALSVLSVARATQMKKLWDTNPKCIHFHVWMNSLSSTSAPLSFPK